jgi:hypothetical protein
MSFPESLTTTTVVSYNRPDGTVADVIVALYNSFRSNFPAGLAS